MISLPKHCGNKGVDVLLFEDLAAESLTSTGLKEQFVAELAGKQTSK